MTGPSPTGAIEAGRLATELRDLDLMVKEALTLDADFTVRVHNDRVEVWIDGARLTIRPRKDRHHG